MGMELGARGKENGDGRPEKERGREGVNGRPETGRGVNGRVYDMETRDRRRGNANDNLKHSFLIIGFP